MLRLILENSPLKEWHFEEIIKEAGISRLAANKWLRKYISESLLTRVKEKGRFSYYTAGQNNPVYLSLKRLYALEQLHKSGLIPLLLSSKTSKTIILFGSMAKGDWYKDSDIDIFVFGTLKNFNKELYESRLGRKIELHIFPDKKEIRQVKSGLMKNIADGYVIKGSLQDISEEA